jgi:hypothetical protein
MSIVWSWVCDKFAGSRHSGPRPESMPVTIVMPPTIKAADGLVGDGVPTSRRLPQYTGRPERNVSLSKIFPFNESEQTRVNTVFTRVCSL